MDTGQLVEQQPDLAARLPLVFLHGDYRWHALPRWARYRHAGR
ncbi:hypothetical protein [Streptomyces collinus]